MFFTLFSSCSFRSDNEAFKQYITEELLHLWKYFAADAIHIFLIDNSNSYDVSILESIHKRSPQLAQKYDEILKVMKQSRTEGGSEIYKKLVNLKDEVRGKQAAEVKKEREEFEKELEGLVIFSDKDLGITEELKSHTEEKYALCIKVLGRNSFDNYWFTIKNISVKNEISFLSNIAVLYIYFHGLPNLQVYFYRDPETTRWVSFYSSFDFSAYFYAKKHQ